MSLIPKSKSKSKSRSRRSAGVLLLVGVLAGVAVGGGVGVMAASSSKSVTVCVNRHSKLMRYRKNADCRWWETKVVLNQTGAQGAVGPKGDTGATGAKGDTGAAGSGGGGASAPVATAPNCIGEKCTFKIGDTGPGGGVIFLVDYFDQYPGFDYMEIAPVSCGATGLAWASDTTHSLASVATWAARAVGAGRSNTAAMVANSGSYVADTSGAAFFADNSTCGGKTDWFLGSTGEIAVANLNLEGLAGFTVEPWPDLWTSSEYSADDAMYQSFMLGYHRHGSKTYSTILVRPVRSF